MRFILFWLVLITQQASAQPLCWPSTIGGSGTQHWTRVITPDAADSAPAGTAVLAVWWHCPDPAAPSGWQTARLLCHRERLAECLARAPLTLAPAALAAAWPATSPLSLDIGWAEAIMWQDFAKATRPAPLRYVVQPYGTALYRATYPVVDGKRGTTSNGRVPVLTAGLPTPANCAAARIAEGANLFCSVLGQTATVAPVKAAP